MRQKHFEAIKALASEEAFNPGAYDINWQDPAELDAFVLLAEQGGVVSWCFHRLMQQGQGEQLPFLVARLKKRYLAILVDNQQRLQLYKHLKQLFGDNNIPFALLKGMALAFTVYPHEALRPMGDLDILVPADKVLQARDLLIHNGARSTHVPISAWHEMHNAHVRPLVLPPYRYMIELHSRLYADGSYLLPKTARWEDMVCQKAGSLGTFSVMSDPWLLYHLCTHLYYGYEMGGLRLGWLIDIARVLEQSDDVATLVRATLAIHKPGRKAVLRALGWSAQFTGYRVRESLKEWSSSFMQEPSIKLYMSAKGEEALHRYIVLRQLLHTRGLRNKVIGLWYQLFPSREYMRHYFGEGPLWKQHLRRLTS